MCNDRLVIVRNDNAILEAMKFLFGSYNLNLMDDEILTI